MLRIFVLSFTLLSSYCQNLSAQSFGTKVPEWEHAMKSQPKPSIIYLHTTWCRYCRMMEKTTFQNLEPKDWVSKHAYWILVDAEDKNSWQYQGKTYAYRPTGIGSGRHSWTELWVDKEHQAFPVLIFLDEHSHILYRHSGYLTAEEFLRLVKVVYSI